MVCVPVTPSERPDDGGLRAWRAGAIGRSRMPMARSACDRHTISRVAVTDEIARCRIPRECFGDLSGDPIGGRFAVTLVPTSRRRSRRRMTSPSRSLNRIVGMTNRSIAAMSAASLRRKARQPGEGGPRRRGMYLATVDWAISIPSFSNSRRWRKRVVRLIVDQIADLCRDHRPADTTTARLPAPVETEAAPMPAHQRLGLEDDRCPEQRRKQSKQPDENQPICPAQAEPRRRGSLQDQ